MAMTLKQLIDKRANVWENAKAFLDERINEGNTHLSAEDEQTYARMEAEIAGLTREIERAQRAERIERDMARATAQPLTSMPGTTPEIAIEEKKVRASNAYRQAFWNAMKISGDPLFIRNALSEGVDSEGSYLVPDEFEQTLVTALAEESTIRGLANVIQTTSGDRKIPVVATHGTAAWLDEGTQYTESNEVFEQVSLSAFKLGTFLKISEELLNDSAFNLET